MPLRWPRKLCAVSRSFTPWKAADVTSVQRLATQRDVATGSSATSKAIDHALKRWAELERYANSGALPIDNNPVESAIRPISIGKKNWLFVGSERAGGHASAIQSLFVTAKLNGLIRRAE